MFTQDEITAKSGVPDELGPQIWRALGFPTPPADVPAFTENDVRALQDIKALLDSEMVDEELVLHLSRAVGQTMGRLASWLGDVWIRRLADRTTDEPLSSDEIYRTIGAMGDLLPTFERLLLQGWRRQLAATGLRFLASAEGGLSDPSSGIALRAVGFADIVSFTRLSRQMDGDSLAGFVERFEEGATEICADLGGRIVKTLGDEVLFCVDDPTAAAEIALRLVERNAEEEGFPRLRVGVTYGEVIQRLGDVFGTPVNLAARLTALAHPGTVLIDRALSAAVAGTSRDFTTATLRSRPVQGLGRIRPSTLTRPRDHHRR